jgi:hypothetical protein
MEAADAEKHAECRKRWGSEFSAVFLPPSLYEAAEHDGVDMRDYVKQRFIPLLDVSSAESFKAW